MAKHIINVDWDGRQVQVKDENGSDATHGHIGDEFTWRTRAKKLEIKFKQDHPFDSAPGTIENDNEGSPCPGDPVKAIRLGEFPYGVVVTANGVDHPVDPIVIIDK